MSLGSTAITALSSYFFLHSNKQLSENFSSCYENRDLKGLSIHLIRALMIGNSCRYLAEKAVDILSIRPAFNFIAKVVIARFFVLKCIPIYRQVYCAAEIKICDLFKENIPNRDETFLPFPFMVVDVSRSSPSVAKGFERIESITSVVSSILLHYAFFVLLQMAATTYYMSEFIRDSLFPPQSK